MESIGPKTSGTPTKLTDDTLVCVCGMQTFLTYLRFWFAVGSCECTAMKGERTKEDILVRLSSLLGSQYERIVHFAQSIPGFGDISKEDQRILLQIGGLEVILLQISQVYDNKSKLLRMWEGMWLSPDQARKLTSDFNLAVFFELLFSLAESLNSMHLREEDIAVFSALLLLASDLQGLKQKMQVEALQDKVLSGFAYMLSQNHRSKPNLLPQVLMCMPTLRTISTSYLELTAAIPRHVAPPPDSTAMCVRHL
ncbi:thyroid hormone receptor alpha-like [Diadema antillarum]|uniref:thyroid hormone receptor alpha-like n=1 Tax=Diadema antillarum TaxID=105358 RepID=UPI003A8C88C7